MTRRRGKPTLSRELWLDAALRRIASAGLDGVAIEPLATELGVTRGSFYHHFKNRDDLIEASLQRWHERATLDVLSALRRHSDPRERLRRLFVKGFDDVENGRMFTALSASVHDARVAAILRVTALERLRFLRECFDAMGHDDASATHHATLALSVYGGIWQLIQSQSTGDDVWLTTTARQEFLEFVADKIVAA